MKRFALAALTVAGLLLHAPTAQACTCAARSLPEHLEAATVVFTGTVRTVAGSAGRVSVALDVSAVYKGEGKRRLAVSTAADPSACGTPFARGSSYVVFATGAPEALSTGLCSGTTDDVTVVAGLSPLETFGTGELPGDEPGSRSLPIGTAAGLLVLVLAAQIGAWLLRARPPRPLA